MAHGLGLSVAWHYARRLAGHQVAFCASGEMAESIQKHGYKVCATPPTTMFGLPALISRILEQRSQRLSLPVKPGKSIGSIWMVMVLSGLGRARYLKTLVEAQRKAPCDFRADAIFTDVDPAAFITAEAERLPMSVRLLTIECRKIFRMHVLTIIRFVIIIALK